MVFLMQAGFTLVESGFVRQKNSQFILIKNVLISCLACILWWFSGYGLAFGDVERFMGHDGWYFGSTGFERMRQDNYLRWVFEFSYLAACVTIFTGPLAERSHMANYLGFACVLAGFLYPSLVAWIWGGGWLQARGFHDFSGSGVVHMTGGLAGFWGALFLGERYGKDRNRKISLVNTKLSLD